MATSCPAKRPPIQGVSNVIFLTVGTQLPFDRLVQTVDQWSEHHPEVEIQAQIGAIDATGYLPRNLSWKESLEAPVFDELCQKADLVIAHAGTGTLLKCFSFNTPLLIVPRKASLGEHRNDHQIATAKHFSKRPGIHIAYEKHEIHPAIDNLLHSSHEGPKLPATADPELIDTLRGTIFFQE